MSRPLREVEAEIATLGRPVFDWSSPARVDASRAAIAEWAAADPARAARYAALAAERDAADAAELAAYRAGPRPPPAPERLTETDALRGVRQWLSGDAIWCVVVGDVGTGKSVAARWAVGARSATQRTRFARAVDVARLSTWDDGAELDALETCSLLALDDLGTEGTGEHARTTIRALLDARHESRRRTVLTSNLVGGDLSRWLGERVTDRVLSSYVRVLCRGQSMRTARPESRGTGPAGPPCDERHQTRVDGGSTDYDATTARPGRLNGR